MIKDTLKNASKYYNLSSLIKQGLRYLQENDLENLAAGKYIINDDLYVNIDEYETKISDKIEAHRKYIDIQYIIKGEENIGVTGLEHLNEICPYDEEKDIIFYNGKCDFIPVKQGEFLVLYPEDAHLPCQKLNSISKVKKAVVKVKIK